MTDIEDVGKAVVVILKLCAFIIGCALLTSGFADFGDLKSSNILIASYSDPMAIVKIVVGVIFVIISIEPAAIAVIIHWIVRS